MLLFPV
jgi:hypothetical protein